MILDSEMASKMKNIGTKKFHFFTPKMVFIQKKTSCSLVESKPLYILFLARTSKKSKIQLKTELVLFLLRHVDGESYRGPLETFWTLRFLLLATAKLNQSDLSGIFINRSTMAQKVATVAG